ncbi:MAG: moderate conductance mechanosensitive channel [Gaiellales bacterium]|nr:moderate conductance mechanosensitive channel [Gaiellales bacterium]
MRFVELNFLAEPWRRAAYVAIAFVLAWVVSRLSSRMAERVVRRYEARNVDPAGASTGVIVSLKRHETIVSLVQTSVRYAAYGLATLFGILQLAGVRGNNGAIAGASLVVLLLGFALQRFLIDILSGVFMQFEGWFAIGDSVVIEPAGLAGIVEETSLRSTKLRSLAGDVIYVNNSQVQSVRVLPRGVRQMSIELVVRDESEGRRLFEDAARVMPVGPTQFVRMPVIESVERLDEDLVLLRGRALVAPGREWLAQGFLASVLRERAAEGLIVHGPVVIEIDDLASRRYARTTSIAERG